MSRAFEADRRTRVNSTQQNSNHYPDISDETGEKRTDSSIGSHVGRTDNHVQNGGSAPQTQTAPEASIADNESASHSAPVFGADNANSSPQQQPTRLYNDMNAGPVRPPPYESTVASTSTSGLPPVATAPEVSMPTSNGNGTRDTEDGGFSGDVREKVSDPPATKPIISPLLILTAMTGSFVHGGNDVRCVKRSTLKRAIDFGTAVIMSNCGESNFTMY